MRNNEERFGAPPQFQEPTPPQVLQQQGISLDFILPTDIVALPSKGKFYPPSHPLHGKDSIELKQMTAKEEDILTSRSLIKKGIVLDKLIESIIVDKRIDPLSLTVEDRSAIIVSARIAAYGPEYSTSVTCPSCEKKVKYTFNLFEKLPKEDEEPQVAAEVDQSGLFCIVPPFSKWKIVCKAVNGYDEKTLVKINEVKKKSSNDSLFLDQLKAMVVSIEGVTEKSLIEKAISSLPAGDTRFLRKEYLKVVPPVDMKQTFVCSNCEHEADMEVPLSADFFWFK